MSQSPAAAASKAQIPSQQQQQQQSPSSPNSRHQHYSHLTYAVRRKKEDETDEGKALSSKARPLVPSSRDPQHQLPNLPQLKVVGGYAISEDGQLMSRFVSPPRFASNSSVLGGNGAASPVRGGGGGGAPVNQVLSPGSIMAPQPVFTATVTAGEGGVPRISIPLQRAAPGAGAAPSALRGGGGAAGQQQDAWSELVHSAAADGMDEDDVALLEWTTVTRLLKHYEITSESAAEGDPIRRARCELEWRRRHDRVVFDIQERQHERGLSRKSASGGANVEEMRQAAVEFRSLVQRLYPPPPIMEAAGGPVLLVRTAPQGEIQLNASNASPRNGAAGAFDAKNTVQKPAVHLRKTAPSARDDNSAARRPFGVRHIDPGPESSPPRSNSSPSLHQSRQQQRKQRVALSISGR